MENTNEKIEKMINKVQGLIKLSEKNDNDEEAQSAFLMAQKLMLKYHISADSLQSAADSEDQVTNNDVTTLKRLYWWEKVLAKVITDNFRVKGFTHSIYVNGKKKSKIVFMGLDDDLKIAKEMYVLTYEAIQHYAKKYINKYYKDQDISRKRGLTEYLKQSYMQGFLHGLEDKFKEQFEELKQEYGLMVMTPEKVQEAFNRLHCRKAAIHVSRYVNGDAYHQGQHDGNSIDYKKQTINC